MYEFLGIKFFLIKRKTPWSKKFFWEKIVLLQILARGQNFGIFYTIVCCDQRKEGFIFKSKIIEILLFSADCSVYLTQINLIPSFSFSLNTNFATR